MQLLRLPGQAEHSTGDVIIKPYLMHEGLSKFSCRDRGQRLHEKGAP